MKKYIDGKYVEMTPEEIEEYNSQLIVSTEEEREVLIDELKQKLVDTDYISCKIAEGSATIEEYAAEIKQRQMWRKEINDLQLNHMAEYYMHCVENNDMTISEVPDNYREDVRKMIYIKSGGKY